MKLLITISGSSKYNPFIMLCGGSGKTYTFTWSNQFNAHVWNKGFVGQDDSRGIDDIFLTNDPFYKPSVKIVQDEEETLAEKPSTKKPGRPRKAVAV